MTSKIILLILTIAVLYSCTNSEEETNKGKNLESDVEEFLQTANEYADEPAVFKSYSDSALQLARNIDYKIGIAKSLNNLGRYDYYRENYQKALNKYLEAKKILVDSNIREELGCVYHRLGSAYDKTAKMDSAAMAFKKAAEIRTAINDSTNLWYSRNNLGLIYWRTSKFDSAVICFEKVADLSRKMGERRLHAVSLNNLGSVYYQWSIYDKAIDNYLKSLEIRKNVEDHSGVSLVLNNIGLVYKDLNQPEKAQQYFQEGMEYAKTASDTNALGYSYNNLGNIYKIDNKLDSAVANNQKALEYYRHIDSYSGILMTLIDLGEIYFLKENYPRAERTFNRALEISDDHRVQWRVAEALFHLGKLNRAKGNYGEAIEFLTESIKMNKTIKKNRLIRDAYKELYKIYNSKGDYKKSYARLLVYEKFEDSVRSTNLSEKIAKMENRYELESYRRKLEERRRDNRMQSLIIDYSLSGGFVLLVVAAGLFVVSKKRKKVNDLLENKSGQIEKQRKQLSEQNDELIDLNKTRDRLFSIVAHDLKNPFVTLSGFTDILKEDINEMNEEEALGYLNEMEDTVRKTYSLLENLLDWTAAQTGKIEHHPANIQLDKLVNSITELLKVQAKNKRIVIEKDVGSNLYVYADWHMIEVVLRNLITNSIKFSEEGGEILLSAKQNSGKVLVSIEDNGTGMDEETKNSLFNIENTKSQKGTKEEKGTGLGLTISKEFVEKNNGEIWVESQIGAGSVFKFTLPSSGEYIN